MQLTKHWLRNLLLLMLLALLVVVLGSVARRLLTPIHYSNLNSTAALSETLSALEQSGVSQAALPPLNSR